jgi:thiamine pyrophosphokinase
LTVAADGGARNARVSGIQPDVVIGDLDSLAAADRAQAETAGARVNPYPERKDETDLELALMYAARRGATSITVLAALGGRLDQTIANILLLALPELHGVAVTIVDGPQTALLVQGGGELRSIAGQPGDILSLLPIGGDAAGVTVSGVEWPLQGSTLKLGPARGVSNVLTSPRASIRLDSGMLLCVHTSRDDIDSREVGGDT